MAQQRRRPSLADLPTEVLRKLAACFRSAEDLIAFRSACKAPWTALDAQCWRQLTTNRFGADLVGEDGDDLETEMRRFGRLLSPKREDKELIWSSIGDKYRDFSPGGTFGLTNRVWNFKLSTKLKCVWPGTYRLELLGSGDVPKVPLDVTLTWQSEPGERARLSTQLQLEIDTARCSSESQGLIGTARDLLTLPSRGAQQPYAVSCAMTAEEDQSWYDWGGGEYLDICKLRLRRVHPPPA